MTNTWWWTVMAGWGVIAAGMISFIWYQAGKADRALQEKLALDYDALFIAVGEQLAADQDDLQRDAAVPISGDAWLAQARRVETLGWLDENDPKRVA